MNNQIAGLEDLLKFGKGNSNIKIAVLDGSVDLKHPCFNTSGGNLVAYETDQIQPSDTKGLALKHGTAVCSLIFGKPNSSVEGVAPGCSGIIIPIYSEDANGVFSSASQVELARAIEMAIQKGANIINVSGGQFSNTGHPDVFLKQAIDKCFKKGILIVAATGNDGCNCLHVPAADSQVLAVGSLDENGEPTNETNFGSSYKINGILAQGKNLTAALAGGETFQTGGGTSYATPMVSGIIGLLMSLQIQQGQKPDAYLIKSIIEKTAIPCVGDGKTDCRRFLRGKINLPAVLAEIQKNTGILASASESHDIENPLSENLMNPSETLPQEDSMTLELSETNLIESFTENGKTVFEQSDSVDTINNLNPETMEPSETMENTKLNPQAEMKGQDSFATMPSFMPSGEIDPSDCGCGGGAKAEQPALVYALGSLGYDFGSESHRDSFIQSMGGANPHDPAAMLSYLSANPWDAAEIIWTLNIDATPIYALFPNGSHAAAGFERICAYLKEQENGTIQRISVPGYSTGTTSLLNGQNVANLFPRIRGMYAWTTEALVQSTVSGEKGAAKVHAENVRNFLDRVYYKMRNLGVSAEERALNYSATNAYQVSSVFASALKDNLELDDVTVTKSPICRPGSDCYDVVMSFFNPRERLTQARKEYRFTVDVSDVVPVTVGEVRSWSVF